MLSVPALRYILHQHFSYGHTPERMAGKWTAAYPGDAITVAEVAGFVQKAQSLRDNGVYNGLAPQSVMDSKPEKKASAPAPVKKAPKKAKKKG